VDERDKTIEVQGPAAVAAVAIVILCLAAGGFLGWRYTGPLGGLLGVLAGTAVGALSFTIIRARATAQRFDEPPAPDVRELPPDQAVQVLSAMMGASATAAAAESGVRLQAQVQGGLLGELSKARTRAQSGDLDGALAKLRSLAEDHPRSPAIPAEMVHILADHEDRTDERLAAASTALRMAVSGGLNRLAKRVHDDLDEDERDKLELDAPTWERLATILAANGAEDDAAASSIRAQVIIDR